MTRVLACYAVPLFWLLSSSSAYAEEEMQQPELVAPMTAGTGHPNTEIKAVSSDVAPQAVAADAGEVHYTLTSCAEESGPSCSSEGPTCGADQPSCGAEASCGAESTCGCESSCGCNSCCCGDWCDRGWDRCWPFCCCCKPGDPCTLQKYLTPCCDCPTYAGWIQIGYHSQNTGLSAEDGDQLDTNDYPGRVQLQQAYFYAEKKAKTDSCCCDWGYRWDAVYGTNGDTPQAFGNQNNGWDKLWDHGVYGFAMPQAYVEVGYNNWDIKIGHFYTPNAYEVYPATGNFFYSHSLSWYNSEPITHTGFLATKTVNDCFSYFGGWVAGWDTAFDSFDGGDMFLGGFTHKISDNLTFIYGLTVGNMGFRSNGEFGYNHSIVVDAKLSDKYEYVMDSDLVWTDGTTFGAGHEEDYEVANYLFYTINDCWKAGVRAEWWKSNQVTGNNASFYELTAGVNYKANANLVLRPEVRYDWTPGQEAVENAQGSEFYNRVEFGIDAILTY